MVHVIDIHNQKLRHFRISRIKRVKLTNAIWEYEKLHVIRRTDPFRIVDENQKLVRLRMNVGAKNELLERFPLTRNYIEEAAEENTHYFHLQWILIKVNVSICVTLYGLHVVSVCFHLD